MHMDGRAEPSALAGGPGPYRGDEVVDDSTVGESTAFQYVIGVQAYTPASRVRKRSMPELSIRAGDEGIFSRSSRLPVVRLRNGTRW